MLRQYSLRLTIWLNFCLCCKMKINFTLFLVLVSLISTLLYCEFLIYYVTIFLCSWPELESKSESLRTFFLADTHLLGPRRGHWFDKLRREWQMHRAFQSALVLLKPDAVFVLGDLFDEGEWSDEEQFAAYFLRFGRLFRTPENVAMHVVPGNHDIGFHYIASPRIIKQFDRAFNLTSVQELRLGPAQFVLVNSMAFEGDDCDLCVDADRKLKELSEILDCGKKGKCPGGRPILLQHFPMYRKSDKDCHEPDQAPDYIKNESFREKWDCLSKEASLKMYNWLRPRAIFTGHTHHGCHTIHFDDIHEFTIPSFSWRNKDNPTFTMAIFTENSFAVKKCFIPRESTVIFIYSTYALGLFFTLIFKIMCWPWLKISPALWPFRKWKHS